ncbi:MAG TPA: type II toxin-antitoxin system RelE/ParE family toxin [Thermoanaerobaculia bacterium]|nr:type II toxin-antitoxin system RelE/ParE family toxin [Thermoanaerobaculia bacterium]
MTRAVRPNAAAEEEFSDYIQWYENESAGLGDRLWLEIQATIELIASRPAIGEAVGRLRVRGSIRRVPLRHFPFLLVYREHPDHLEIVALAHTSRKPRYWRDRLK